MLLFILIIFLVGGEVLLWGFKVAKVLKGFKDFKVPTQL